jgi:hypothetical protein
MFKKDWVNFSGFYSSLSNIPENGRKKGPERGVKRAQKWEQKG